MKNVSTDINTRSAKAPIKSYFTKHSKEVWFWESIFFNQNLLWIRNIFSSTNVDQFHKVDMEVLRDLIFLKMWNSEVQELYKQFHQYNLHYELQRYFYSRGNDKVIDSTGIQEKIQGNVHTSCRVPEKPKIWWHGILPQ